ncbi:peptide chain release factor N(5)-glutamine methyltransferase [Candidatus Margulisiibacteriota bacterium]
MNTYFKLLKFGQQELKTARIDNPQLESELLLTAAFQITKAKLLQELNTPLSGPLQKKKAKTFYKYLNQRKTKMPIAYILGNFHFRNHQYQIQKKVFIPRPETELLVEKCLEVIQQKAMTIIEIGFGSGVIGIELALACPKSQVFAWDISKKAYQTAMINAKNLGCKNIHFYNEDFYKSSALKKLIKEQENTLIVSNPPYIPNIDVQGLDADVRLYEPQRALKGGKKGLNIYKKIFRLFQEKNLPIVLEIGINQKYDLEKMLVKYNYNLFEFFKDYNGIDRMLKTVILN